VLLEIENLSVEFPSPRGPLPAVQELSLTLEAGETLALVGESGSGKSVTALAILDLLPPEALASGAVRFEGRDLTSASHEEWRSLRGRRMAMIFQEPMTALNPVMRVGDQVAEAVLAHDATVSRAEARRRAIEALREVSIPEPERRWRDYPHQLSGGQRQRVMIAIAIVNRPALLIADEPTTALDVTVQAQILELLDELRLRLGLAMLFVSHDLAVVRRVSQRVAVMYAGRVVESGAVDTIFERPAHPYTRGLLASIPTLATDRSQPLRAIEGAVPSPASIPSGCAFAPRCPLCIPACQQAMPVLAAIASGNSSSANAFPIEGGAEPLAARHCARCIRAGEAE